MRLEEFSNQFDLLASSYRRFKDFDDKELLDSIEFDEYEKSLFLTKAQEQLVLSLYNGRNVVGESFEETEELRRYLSSLVCEATLSPITNTSGKLIGMEGKNSYFFTLPEEPPVWFITYESVILGDDGKCDFGGQIEVVPIRQDEYHRIKSNPFRGANNRRALRLDLAEDNIEIISKRAVAGYYLRYLKRIKPIVLVDLPNELSIEGISVATDCEVHQGLHQRILELAVDTAIMTKIGGLKKTSDEDK